MGEHYVCESCGGVSEETGDCGTPGCEKEGHPLTPCACEDPEHQNGGTPDLNGSEDEEGEE